ncbi:MAG: mobile mystery protein A [Bacteroidales bacterium]
MKKQKLILEQMDRKIQMLNKIRELAIPGTGWVYAIRQSLGMSMRQLGKKMGMTAQGIRDLEEREKNGSVSLNVLRQFGISLEMKLVYGFIPKQQSLEAIIEERALELAREIVGRTSVSMKLEDQENNPARIEKAIKEKATELKYEMPRYLWD